VVGGVLVELLAQVADLVFGVGELVLQADDASGGGEGVAAVELFAQPHDQRELAAGIAAVPAFGALRAHHVGGVQASQERLLHIEHPGGLPGGEGWIVLVVELAQISHAHSIPTVPCIVSTTSDYLASVVDTISSAYYING
jgi:hypothetical protein